MLSSIPWGGVWGGSRRRPPAHSRTASFSSSSSSDDGDPDEEVLAGGGLSRWTSRRRPAAAASAATSTASAPLPSAPAPADRPASLFSSLSMGQSTKPDKRRRSDRRTHHHHGYHDDYDPAAGGVTARAVHLAHTAVSYFQAHKGMLIVPIVVILFVSQAVEEQRHVDSLSHLTAPLPPPTTDATATATSPPASSSAEAERVAAAAAVSEAARRLSEARAMQKDPETDNADVLRYDVAERARSVGVVIPEQNSQGHNVSALSQVLYGMYRHYRLRSVLDVTCRRNAEWIRPVLRVIIADADDAFRYYCLDEDPVALKDTIPYFKGFQSIYFIRRDLAKMRLPQVGLIFGLDYFQMVPPSASLEILKNIKKNHSPIVLFTHNPSVANPAEDDAGAGKYKPINLKASPFRIGPPMRVFDRIAHASGEQDASATQLLLLNATEAFPFEVEQYPRF